MSTPRCLTIATSDSGGGAGVQADLKAFAAAGCFGTSAIVALTAQNTLGVQATEVLSPGFINAQLESVFDDIGVDALKTGALISHTVVDAVAGFLERRRARGDLPAIIVDPVVHATTGAQLLDDTGVDMLIRRLVPLATVVTPNDREAQVLAGMRGNREQLAERIVARGARAVIITGGEGEPADHVFDGRQHVDIAWRRVGSPATHGSGCTHAATVCARLARGDEVVTAARIAQRTAAAAIERGLTDIGSGDGPVDVIGLRTRRGAGAVEPV